MKKKWIGWNCVVLAVAGACAIPSASWATSLHFEGFEDAGWVANQAGNWQDFGGATITRVASGTNGIASSDGAAHAVLTTGQGPFTFFGGYSSTFGGGFVASQDIYLDTAWGVGTGFDFSTAVSGTDGNHQRDFIWHVGVVDGLGLIVNASNNTDGVFNAGKLTNNNNGNYGSLASSGWYTFETVFYDDGGLLYVDYNLYDSLGTEVYSVVRGGNVADIIPTEVGGNRYGWFTYNDVTDLAIDNTSLAPVPEPATMTLLGLGLAGLVARQRRKKA